MLLRFKKKKIETKIGKGKGAQKDPLVKFYNQRDICPQKIGSFFNITAPLLPHFPNTNTDNSLTPKKKKHEIGNQKNIEQRKRKR